MPAAERAADANRRRELPLAGTCLEQTNRRALAPKVLKVIWREFGVRAVDWMLR